MPFTKVFGPATLGNSLGSNTGVYSLATNWNPISVRNSAYAWTASGSGTNEYYLRTAASGNPGFAAQPTNVYINGATAGAAGTVGSLTAGQWGYGDNDTLGYSTIYVRLSGGGDPDAQARDHIQFYQIPQAGEHVRFAANSYSITSATGLDQSAVAIGDFIVEEGCEALLGSALLGYLAIDPDRFEFNGRGEAWLDLTTAAVSPQIYGTYSPSEGNRGLYLKGSALAVVNMMGGSVGIAVRPGETATATTVRVLGKSTSLWLGNGVTLTNLHQYAGRTRVRCAVTTTILYDGTLTSEENGAMTTVTQHAGTYDYQSSGNITTYNLRGGTLDCQKSGAARTIDTLNKYLGSSTIRRNKEAVTISSEVANDTYTETVSA